MKQVAQNYRSGELAVLDVPEPGVPAGRRPRALAVLTDLHGHRADEGLRGAALPARQGAGPARPGEEARRLAWPSRARSATYKKAMNRLDSYTPLGYSLCGVVVEVGAGAEEFAVGDLVAAAGNEFALHAEVNWVPINLCVPVPEGSIPEHAAFATVGAIAMQGVRRGGAAAGRARLRHRARARRSARRPAARGCRGPGRRARHRRGALPAGRGRGRAGLRGSGPRRRWRWSRRSRAARPADWASTTCSSLPAAAPTSPSRSRRGWRATGPASSTSARRGSTSRGTPTTRRSSTSASPAPTARGATTTATSSGGDRLPGRVRALDRAPQPGLLPRPPGHRPALPGSAGVERASGRRGDPGLRRAEQRGAAGRRPPAGLPGRRDRVPASDGAVGPGRQGRRVARRAAIRHGRRRPAGLRRRRQLRHLDAAAPPRQGPRRQLCTPWPRPGRCRRSTPSASSGSSTPPRTRTTSWPTLDRRRLRGDSPSSHADFVLPGAGARQGRVRREAARPDEDQLDRRARGRRAHRQRPPHGGLQPSLRAAGRRAAQGRSAPRPLSVDGPLPRQRRPAGPGQLVPRRGGGRVPVHSARAATSSTPSPGSSARTRWRSTRCSAAGAGDLQLMLRYPDGSLATITYATGRPRALPEGDPRLPGAAATPAWTTSPRPRCGAAAGKDPKRSLPAQDKGQRADARAVRRGGAARRRDADLDLDSLSRRPARPIARREPVHGRVGVRCEPGVGLVRPTAPPDVRGRGARVAVSTAAASSPGRGRACQVGTPGDAPPRVADRRLAPTASRPVPRSRVQVRRGRRRVIRGRRRPARRATGPCSGSSAPTSSTRTGSSDPVTGRRAPQDQLAFRIDHRDEAVTGNVKSVWELSRHHHLTVLAAAFWLTGDDRYAEVVAAQLRSWWASQPVPLGGPLDQRDRARRPAGQLGVDPSAARRLARCGRPVRGRPVGAAPDLVAPALPRRLPQPGILGQQPCGRRSVRPAGRGLCLSLVRGE